MNENELNDCLNGIFRRIEREFPYETFESFKATKKEDLWQAHFGFGTWLKRTLLNDDYKTRAIFERHGIDEIDDMSSFIIDKFQDYLIEIDVDIED